jgi:23S rRNA G2069 N7-methylase RlmK/C1962 C5-methylase RlmI
MQIHDLLIKSVAYRSPVVTPKNNVVRVCSGQSDGVPGVIIDQFAKLIVVLDYSGLKTCSEWKTLVQQIWPESEAWIKVRSAPGQFNYHGIEGQEFICNEAGDQFIVKPTREHDIGLFVDTKAARNWLRSTCYQKNILNLFAYSCAFAIAGKRHGALQVTNIDPNMDYLNWGKRNAELNQTDFKNYKDTTQKYLPRHLRRLESGTDQPYDIIITDPPAFLVGRGDDRLGRKIWPSMLAQMKQSQASQLLLICNDRSFRSSRVWEKFLTEHLGTDFDLTPLPQSQDVLGQDPRQAFEDPHYSPPYLTLASR